MSLRALYQRIPESKRTCNFYRCRNPILRNIDMDKDGRIYHHGCLMEARDERWRCLECFTVFDATEAVFEEAQKIVGDDVTEQLKVLCPGCGGSNIKSLHGQMGD
jgi:hypothetical protein